LLTLPFFLIGVILNDSSQLNAQQLRKVAVLFNMLSSLLGFYFTTMFNK